MTKPVTKTASHDTAHECRYLAFDGTVTSHVPGIEINVQWSVGCAATTREALDRAVAEVRAQIIDAEESDRNDSLED